MNASSAGSEAAPRLRPVPAAPVAWLARGVNLPLALAALALLAYALGAAGPYDLRVLALCGIYALLVIGFQFVFGHAGAVSLAQSCFFGIGGYVTGVLGTRYGLDAAVTLPASVLAAVAIAAVVAAPVLRLDDHYFALATLTLTLLGVLVATQWESVTGGTNGLPGIPPLAAFGAEIVGRRAVFVAVWLVLGLGALAAFQVTRGLYGLGFHLLRENAQVASALGLDVGRLRLAAFLLSAGYAAVAGALLAHVLHVVSPEVIDLPLMVTCLTMTVVGGRLSIAGAVLGALLVTYLREEFRVLENTYLIAYGAVTLAFLVIAPDGLVGRLERLRVRLLPERPPALPSVDGPAGATAGPAPGPATGAALLAARGITKAFGGNRALDGVSLALRPGEVVGLIGPNGSGKTTLLNIVSGVIAPDAGSVEVGGRDVTRSAPFAIARLGVARTFQHIHLVDDLSVLDNVAVGLAGRAGTGLWRSLLTFGPDPRLARARAVALAAMETLGIAAHSATPCGALPYGLRRRVEVARALARAPSLLLLDEPAAGLNEEEQRDLARRIRAVAAAGVTVLVIEHNLIFLGQLAERLVCLDRGRVIAAGDPAVVRADPRVVEAYLGTAAAAG